MAGIGDVVHTPEYEIELRWYRHGEGVHNRTRFLMAESTNFELLLESSRFAPEVSSWAVTALPLFGRRKPKGKSNLFFLTGRSEG